jgi:hypothetical protein
MEKKRGVNSNRVVSPKFMAQFAYWTGPVRVRSIGLTGSEPVLSLYGVCVRVYRGTVIQKALITWSWSDCPDQILESCVHAQGLRIRRLWSNLEKQRSIAWILLFIRKKEQNIENVKIMEAIKIHQTKTIFYHFT